MDRENEETNKKKSIYKYVYIFESIRRKKNNNTLKIYIHINEILVKKIQLVLIKKNKND